MLGLREPDERGVGDVLELALSAALVAQRDLGRPRVQGPVDAGHEVRAQAKEQEGREPGQDGGEQHDVPGRQPGPDGKAHRDPTE